jgi:hypothetical protein
MSTTDPSITIRKPRKRKKKSIVPIWFGFIVLAFLLSIAVWRFSVTPMKRGSVGTVEHWTHGFGDDGYQAGDGVAIDAEGNVLVSGVFTGTFKLGGRSYSRSAVDNVTWRGFS